MKIIKFTLLVVMSLVTCFFLSACGNKQESATSSSSKVTQTTKSSEKSATSSTKEKATANSSSQDSKASQKDTGSSSNQDANTNQKEDTTTQMATASMDIQAIAGGDLLVYLRKTMVRKLQIIHCMTGRSKMGNM